MNNEEKNLNEEKALESEPLKEQDQVNEDLRKEKVATNLSSDQPDLSQTETPIVNSESTEEPFNLTDKQDQDARAEEQNAFISDSSNVVTSLDESSEQENKEMVFYAGFWLRFWAFLIDLIMIGCFSRIIVTPLFTLMGISMEDTSFFAPINIGDSIVFFGYFILMTKFFGATIGKMIFGLKVISLKTKKLTWGTIIFRELIGRYIHTISIAFVLYLLVAFMPDKKSLLDIIADTTVILDKKGRVGYIKYS